MKYAAILILFLFFTTCLSGVRYADSYSQRYGSCAADWIAAVNNTKNNPAQSALLKKTLLNDTRINPSGQLCPALTAQHREKILVSLKQANS